MMSNMEKQESANKSSSQEVECTVVLIGDARVGKTALLKRFTDDLFQEDYLPTSFDKKSSSVKINGHKMNFTLWDTAGSSSFDSIRSLSYEDADVFLLCYKITDPLSLYNVKLKWLAEILKHRPDSPPIILCGCGADLRSDPETLSNLAKCGRSPVTHEQALAVCCEIGAVNYVESSSMSAVSAGGFGEPFELCALAALNKYGVEKLRSENKKKETGSSVRSRPFTGGASNSRPFTGAKGGILRKNNSSGNFGSPTNLRRNSSRSQNISTNSSSSSSSRLFAKNPDHFSTTNSNGSHNGVGHKRIPSTSMHNLSFSGSEHSQNVLNDSGNRLYANQEVLLSTFLNTSRDSSGSAKLNTSRDSEKDLEYRDSPRLRHRQNRFISASSHRMSTVYQDPNGEEDGCEGDNLSPLKQQPHQQHPQSAQIKRRTSFRSQRPEFVQSEKTGFRDFSPSSRPLHTSTISVEVAKKGANGTTSSSPSKPFTVNFESIKSHGSTGSTVSSKASTSALSTKDVKTGIIETEIPDTESPQLLQDLRFVSPKTGVFRPVSTAGTLGPDASPLRRSKSEKNCQVM